MNKKLFTLALSLTVIGMNVAAPALVRAQLIDDIEVDITRSFNEFDDVDDSFNTLNAELDVDIDDSFNRIRTDVDNDDSFNRIRTQGDLSPAMSNSEIEDSTFGKTVGNFSPVLGEDAEIEDSQLGNNSAHGDLSPALGVGAEIEDSSFGKTTGALSPVLGTDAEIEDSDFVSQSSTGNNSPNLMKSDLEDSFNTQNADGQFALNVTKGEVEDNNFANMETRGNLSPNLQDSEIEDSNFVGWQRSNGGASPNLVDSEIEDSNLAEQYAHGEFAINQQDSNMEGVMFFNDKVEQQGQLNVLTTGRVDIGNVAGDESTIFDGDINIGGLGGGGLFPALNGPGGLGGGDIEMNVNSGVAYDSVIGNENDVLRDMGIGINGPANNATLTNTQNTFVTGANYNLND